MPKRGMFRRNQNYQQVDKELAGRAFACLYGLHGYLTGKESKKKHKKMTAKNSAAKKMRRERFERILKSRIVKGAATIGLLVFAQLHANATFTLTLSTAGPASAASVTSSSAGINCGNGSSTCSASFAAGSTVTLTEIPGSTVVFAGWGGANGCPNNFDQCAIVMDGARSVTASFDPVLAVSLHGNGLGTVTSSTGSIDCAYTNGCASGASVTQSFAPGTVVVLHSSAATNSSFVGWTGGGCSTASTCTVTMNSYKTVIATYTSSGPFTISVSKGGSGLGTVTSSPTGINCGGVCRSTFSAGASVTLTASTGTSSYFAGWANGGCSGTSTCVVVSSSAQQGLGGPQSPAAFFYR